MEKLSSNIKNLQTVCKKISEIKEQLIEELPHYGHQALYLHNDEVTTGQLNNKTEIKINLLTGQLLYFHNEKGQYIDLIHDDISKKLKEITIQNNLKFVEDTIVNPSIQELHEFQNYAISAKQILELLRMNLQDNFTQVHLWPHHFDFSLEWFTGNKDEQIGTGLSPGDEQYSEPYMYMNPWPFNEKLKALDLPIGKWHTEGWNGVKIEWSEIVKYTSTDAVEKIFKVFEILKKDFVRD